MRVVSTLICYRLLLCIMWPITTVIGFALMCIIVTSIFPLAWLISTDADILDNFMHKLVTATLDTIYTPIEFIGDRIDQLITKDEQ